MTAAAALGDEQPVIAAAQAQPTRPQFRRPVRAAKPKAPAMRAAAAAADGAPARRNAQAAVAFAESAIGGNEGVTLPLLCGGAPAPSKLVTRSRARVWKQSSCRAGRARLMTSKHCRNRTPPS